VSFGVRATSAYGYSTSHPDNSAASVSVSIMVGAGNQCRGVSSHDSVLLGSGRHADSPDGLGALCIGLGVCRLGCHSHGVLYTSLASKDDLALDSFGIGSHAVSAGEWHVSPRGESLRFYIRAMKRRPNEAIHRMSGHHISSIFGRRGRPLIGDLNRWAGPCNS
jgi:hypothetical protein